MTERDLLVAQSTGRTTVMVNREGGQSVRLRCPSCKSASPPLDLSAPIRWTCPGCEFAVIETNGIVRSLTAESEARFDRFVRDYQVVRSREGWGSPTPEYYLALPFRDLTRKHDWIWGIRGRTLLYIQRHVLHGVEREHSGGCDILDIGAGNGWLSYRLAKRGHRPVAVDLLDDDLDGLGAAKHYLAHLPKGFPRFQAEMDHLPFDSGQFDIAIFNASFHYSSDYERTLREVMRCLRRPGLVIIADSPLYQRDESGQQMLEERRASFERQFGIRSEGISSREYLTPRILSELSQSLDIRWNIGKPWYGLQWALRPAKARLLRRREPSKFYLLWFEVKK